MRNSTLALALCCTGVLSGCFNLDSETRVTTSEDCSRVPAYFANKVWGPVLSQRCIQCHNTDGQARSTRFVLTTGDSAEVIERNLSVFSSVARMKQDGTSLVLLKPTAKVPHGGGVQLSEDSDEYRNLLGFVSQVEKCQERCTPKRTPARVRRLNRHEYDQTILALLQDSSQPADTFPVDDRVNGYTNDAFALRVSGLLAEQLFTTAETIGTSAGSRGVLTAACNVATKGEPTCAKEFIQTFASKAFRRPATAEETDGLWSVYQTGRTGGTYQEGLELVVTAVVQSASFLYNTELGDPTTLQDGHVQLAPYELASALSYLITGGPPDAALINAAATRQLSGSALEAQARRLLALPEAKTQLSNFFFQWLNMEKLDTLEKDPTSHPSFTPTLRASMRTELQSFVSSLMFTGDRTLKSVFTDRRASVDTSLAALYGLPAVPVGTRRDVTLDSTQRAGLLTRASVLATFAQAIDSSPILRGKLVRTRVLCQQMPPPPDDLDIVFPPRLPSTTTRQRFEQHATVAACRGCHQLMDPIGYGFEGFDGIGTFRTSENGQAVDTRGEVLATRDANGAFQGPLELSARLAQSTEVQECFSRHLYQFVAARGLDSEDECSLRPAQEKFSASGTDVVDLLVHYALSDSFVLRSLP
jgi:hypothetical protein